ncbi:hypothetical protein OE165_28825, partial [Escherichia coli]|uniref:hypothetical protein n=1 Tax=Escherichia coli TaxID=562 RepID=UPI0021F2C41A
LDYQLKRLSLNFFIVNVLPAFEMNWHHIEWGNMVMYNRLLTVLAARDHSKSFYFSFAYPLWRLFKYERPDLQQRMN